MFLSSQKNEKGASVAFVNMDKGIKIFLTKPLMSVYLYWQRIVFSLLLVFILRVGISAQPRLDFLNFTQKEGLSSNYVFAFYQDHLGFMWIGTEGGLNRFDGQNFLKFRFDPEDEETINHDWVVSIHEDKQHNLWIGTEVGLNLLNKVTGKIERIPAYKSGQKIQCFISNFWENPEGRLWVNSFGYGFFELKKTSGNNGNWYLEEFEIGDLPIRKGDRITELLLATSDVLWLRDEKTIKRFHIPSRKLSTFTLPLIKTIDSQETGTFAAKYMGDGNIMVLAHKTLFLLDTKVESPEIKPLMPIDYGKAKIDHKWDFFFAHEGLFLIPENRNFYWYDLKTGELDTIRIQDQTSHNLFANLIRYTFQDRQGNYWLGTEGSGFYLSPKKTSPFTYYKNDPANSNSVSKGQVRSFLEDGRGNLWVGILNHGLDQFVYTKNKGLEKRQSIVPIPNQSNTLASNRMVKIIQGPEQSILIASLTHGLIQMDSSGQQFTYLNQKLSDPIFKSNNRLWALEKDQQGYIWVGTWSNGLFRINPRTESIQRFSHDPSNKNSLLTNNIRCLYSDRQNILWIGTDRGLGKYDPKTQQFTSYVHDPKNPGSLSENLVWAIYKDQNHDLWVGTNTGLNRLDEKKQEFEHFYKKDGLPDNTIYGILEDDEGILWVSTENGLARQLPPGAETSFFPLGLMDGLPITSFITKAYFNSTHSEQLFFGTTDGFLSVNPRLLPLEVPKPQLAIHSLSTFNPYEEDGELLTDYFVSDRKEIVKLGYKDQTISITLSDLNWTNNLGLRYEYQLTGFNRQWMPLEEDMQITFTNLSPGRYQLKARAKNVENIFSEATELVRFRVYPPWWKSMVAYLIYILLIAAIITALYRFQLRRQIEKQEAHNLKTLDAFKNKLYTNITHEFRTPLTIITGMTRKINQNPDLWLTKGVKMINRNAEELLNLVNQILDLRKLEAGKLNPKLIQGDILAFINYISESFHSMGADKKIHLTFEAKSEELIMDYDPEMILRIVSNLLSNAIKFSKKGGEVILQAVTVKSPEHLNKKSPECLLITVKDEGIGISEEQLPYIFERFYQVDDSTTREGEGTGIGLSLTRELIQLQGGEIEVESRLGEGSSFLVWLPIHRIAPLASETPLHLKTPLRTPTQANEKSVETPLSKAITSLPNLLIIEDNKDVRQYLTACLVGQYHLSYAIDGEAGIEKALEEVPDIIISDVMMPKKDGFEVCNYLKKDRRTSHIPIIILTAKSDADSRISGLEVGADAYLSKPFNEKELFVRLEKLLEIRKTLQERYQSIGNELFSAGPVSSKEDVFIKEIQEIILQNLSDETFGITELCRALQVSRAQLHNKLKALTGRSASHYIRSIRIHKSKEMLINNPKLNISEIAFETGFSNLNYFSRIFREEIGSSPSKYRKDLLSQ